MKRVVGAMVVGAVAVLLIGGYLFFIYFADISTPPQVQFAGQVKAIQSKPVVYVGVISRYTPTTIYQGYQPIMDYLTAATSYRFELKLRRTYGETVDLLASGEVAVAFLGRKVYLQGRDQYGLTAILKPLNDDFSPTFQDAVITRSDSKIHSLQDLVNCSIALPSRDSYAGNWLKAQGFIAGGQGKFPLKKIQHFEHHHTVVHEVLRGNFDAGVVRESVAEENEGKGISIIAKSQPVPGSPIVATKRTDPEIVAEFTRALMAVDPRKPEFADQLTTWDKEFRYGFAIATDRDYDHLNIVLDSLKAER